MGAIKLNVLVSYSHTDETWLKRVQVHLKPLAREGRLELWDDTRIKTGQRWREEIKAALARADVAVLLISADFYASDFIANNELPPLLEAARSERGLVIVGLHINYSRFDRDEILSEYQTVNTPDRPIEDLSRAQQEKVFDDLARTIEGLLERHEDGRSESQTNKPPDHSIGGLPLREKKAVIDDAAECADEKHLESAGPRKHRGLLAALHAGASLAGRPEITAQRVRSISSVLGLEGVELISALETLRKRGRLEIRWGGDVRVVEPGHERAGGHAGDASARPSFSGTFHGPVIVSTGVGAQIDARGSGYGAAYKPTTEAAPEVAFGALAAAIAELQACLADFEAEDAAKVRELKAAALEVAKRGLEDQPNRVTLRERVETLSATINDVVKLQNAAAKLGPTLRAMRDAATSLGAWLSGLE